MPGGQILRKRWAVRLNCPLDEHVSDPHHPFRAKARAGAAWPGRAQRAQRHRLVRGGRRLPHLCSRHSPVLHRRLAAKIRIAPRARGRRDPVPRVASPGIGRCTPIGERALGGACRDRFRGGGVRLHCPVGEALHHRRRTLRPGHRTPLCRCADGMLGDRYRVVVGGPPDPVHVADRRGGRQCSRRPAAGDRRPRRDRPPDPSRWPGLRGASQRSSWRDWCSSVSATGTRRARCGCSPWSSPPAWGYPANGSRPCCSWPSLCSSSHAAGGDAVVPSPPSGRTPSVSAP
jgi:hypothetical protein